MGATLPKFLDGSDADEPVTPSIRRTLDRFLSSCAAVTRRESAAAPANTEASNGGLRDQVLAGGVYLVVRQLAVLVLGVVGAVALTRLIGPFDYGL